MTIPEVPTARTSRVIVTGTERKSVQSIPAFRFRDGPFIVKRQFEEIAYLLLVFAVKILSRFQTCPQRYAAYLMYIVYQ